MAGLIQKDTTKKVYKDRSAKIEHYSLMLRDGKINEKYFLKIMANVDNKIVFDEAEFPNLDVDEIEFADDADKDLYIDILKQSNAKGSASSSDAVPVNGSASSSDAVPVVGSASSSDEVPVVLSTTNTDPESVTVTSPKSPIILTRSKSRKALKKNDSVPEKELSAPNKRNNKRRAEENSSENVSEAGGSSKRSKVRCMP